MKNYLTIPEEILLLTMDQKSGKPMVDDHKTLDVVLASAILMNLAMENRIDTDLESMFYISDKPFGNVVLDDAIKEIKENYKIQDPVHWLGQFALNTDETMELIIANLIGRGVLKVESNKLLWVFGSKTHTVKDNAHIIDVRTRVRELVFSDEIPEIRDMVIVSLAHYGSMLNFLFSDDEIRKHKERIEQIAKMDLIGQTIAEALKELANKSSFKERTRSFFGIKTPEEKLEKLVEELMVRFIINDNNKLPDWLRKGSDQYAKTLAFVEEKGTADIYYHRRKDEYFVRGYAGGTHIFGGGA